MKKNKSNAIKCGPWNLPARLVEYIESYRKKHNLTKTAVIIEALEVHREMECEKPQEDVIKTIKDREKELKRIL
jgi:hypothetical protein